MLKPRAPSLLWTKEPRLLLVRSSFERYLPAMKPLAREEYGITPMALAVHTGSRSVSYRDGKFTAMRLRKAPPKLARICRSIEFVVNLCE